MKYYIYISDAKVDMLLPQVPHDLKQKVATEYKVDLKIFQVSRSTEKESEEDRITRLEAVLAFLREFGKVGSTDQPDDYIEGVLPMHFVSLGEDGSIVYLTGSQGETVVALGGSAKHLLSAAPNPMSEIRFPSLSYGILRFVAQELLSKEPETSVQSAKAGDLANVINLESLMREDLPVQVDFLAKTLLRTREPFRGMNGILATPLYLALADSS